MTKEERLQELKEQEQFCKVLDKEFDKGWKEFVKDIFKKNDISNIRVFKILYKIKGEGFVTDLRSLMKSVKRPHAYLQFTRKYKGILIKDSRFKTIPEFLIEKFPSGNYNECALYIQIRANRWIRFVV